ARRSETGEARRLYEEALCHRRRAGDIRGEAETLGNLGTLAHWAGEYDEARRLYREGLSLRRSLRDRYGVAVMLHNLGELAEIERDLERAAGLFLNAERLLQDVQSAEAIAPADALRRLSEQLGGERLASLRAVVERLAWDELVEGRSEAPPGSSTAQNSNALPDHGRGHSSMV